MKETEIKGEVAPMLLRVLDTAQPKKQSDNLANPKKQSKVKHSVSTKSFLPSFNIASELLKVQKYFQKENK